MKPLLGYLLLFCFLPELQLTPIPLPETQNVLAPAGFDYPSDTATPTRRYSFTDPILSPLPNRKKGSRRLQGEPPPPLITLAIHSNDPQDEERERGRLLLNVLCINCHSKMLIQNARKSCEQWDSTLTKMERQGLAELPSSWRQSLLRYLETAQGIQEVRRAPGFKPWADSRDANPLW